jgi:predicted ATP-grasp superfamily ATP-dependent carboligase
VSTPVLLGDSDMVRALGLGGLRCVLVASLDDVAHHSRFVVASIDADRDDLVEALVAHAESEPEAPVLFVQSDAELMILSRHRDRLLGPFRVTLPAAGLIEDLLDKARFQELAGRLGLDVPRSAPLGADAGLRPPLVVKPRLRDDRWRALAGKAKAFLATDDAALARLEDELGAAGIEAVAQEVVEGPESRIASYHLYRAPDGEVLGEFTGRKLRTRPAAMGYSTAVVITDDPQVRALGRDAVERLGLVGPAKLDFKRDAAGRPRLLEVNARFTLWAHPGALAGVNLAAIAHDDLTGAPRRPASVARAGVRWCDVVQDAAAVRERGGSLRRWMRFALASEARAAASLDDPMPVLRRLVRRLS